MAHHMVRIAIQQVFFKSNQLAEAALFPLLCS
jgi:hypothetical protein